MEKMIYSYEHHSVLLDHNEKSRLCNIIFDILHCTIAQIYIVPHFGYNTKNFLMGLKYILFAYVDSEYIVLTSSDL